MHIFEIFRKHNTSVLKRTHACSVINVLLMLISKITYNLYFIYRVKKPDEFNRPRLPLAKRTIQTSNVMSKKVSEI